MSVDIQFNVDQALAKMGELVAKHGPQAIDLAAQVVRIDAIGQLLVGGAFAAASALAVMSALHCQSVRASQLVIWDAYRAQREKYDYPITHNGGARAECPTRPAKGDGEAYGVGSVVAWIVAGIATAVSLVCLLDVWSWVALFDPKLSLAHQVLAKLAGI